MPRTLLHGQSEDVEARATAQLIHKIIHEAFTNHNKVLANTIGNVMKEVFFRVPVDQVGPSYFNSYNPLAVGSSVPSSSQQWAVSAATSTAAFREDKLKIKPYKWQGHKVKPCQQQGARSNDRGQLPAQQSPSAPFMQIVQHPMEQN